MAHFNLTYDQVKLWTVVSTVEDCYTTIYSSNTRVATTSWDQIITVAPGTTRITANWWECAWNYVDFQVLSYEPFFQEDTIQELAIVELVFFLIIWVVLFALNFKKLF